MLFETFLGLIVFLIANLSIFYAAHLIAQRFFPHLPHAARLVGIGVLYYGFIIAALQLLSPAHAITRIWSTALCLTCAMASHLLWGRFANLRADLEPVKAWVRDGFNSPWACLMVICGLAAAISLTRALLMPPLAWDCLTYHLTLAALWIKKGAIFLFMAPDQIITAAHLPINGELFAAWLLLPFQTDLIVNTMNFPITLLGGIACYAIARELGLSRMEASFAPALICFSPMIYWQIVTQYVDNATFAFYCASVLFALRYIRTGHPADSLLAFAAGGILLGIKYTAIPAVGLIVLASGFKTVSLTGITGIFRKSGLLVAGLLLLCLLGGRQYILNAIEARNPLYPFPVKVGHQEIFQGDESLGEINAWVSRYEDKKDLDKFSFWERQYRAFLYLTVSAGPKFMLFLALACASLLVRPRQVSHGEWYFLAMMWIVPLIMYYTGASSSLASGGPWMDGNTRYLSPFFALLTLQGLLFLRNLGRNGFGIYITLTAFVFWDLLMINKGQRQEVEFLYPFIPPAVLLGVILFKVAAAPFHRTVRHSGMTPSLTGVPGRPSPRIRGWVACCLMIVPVTVGCYLLQLYRDNTRYHYFSSPTDLNAFQRISVDSWQFLDRPGEKKTIAVTMAWDPPGHKWILYPLLGRRLQNDIVYVSARYKWDVPTWLSRGELRGDDADIWHFNLKTKNVDCVVVADPIAYPFLKSRKELTQGLWPIELGWMEKDPGTFKLVFEDRYCKIFQCVRRTGQ